MKYETALAWKKAAMHRDQCIGDKEVQRRKQMAKDHVIRNKKEASGDGWDDYMLYIMGKMELEEYQAYLLFKHSNGGL